MPVSETQCLHFGMKIGSECQLRRLGPSMWCGGRRLPGRRSIGRWAPIRGCCCPRHLRWTTPRARWPRARRAPRR
eukprot:9472791-Pyramimonas_sp.AAC.1